MLVVAIEGPSHAGKSTLIGSLSATFGEGRVITLPDYVDVVSDPDLIPRAPGESVQEELEALEFFLTLDAERWNARRVELTEQSIVLADRSYHTLLAHRYAIERLTGLPVFEPSCQEVAASTILRQPDLIIYLDVPQDVLDGRYESRVGGLSERQRLERLNLIFNRPDYNTHFREYFIPQPKFGNTPTTVVSGLSTADELLGDVVRILSPMV